MSSSERFEHACQECRKLIVMQLQARDELERALARGSDAGALAVLTDRVDKLTASTQQVFLKAMAVLPSARS